MINLEAIASKLTRKMYDGTDLSEVEKAKIEYGISLLLGVGLALTASLLLAVVFKTVPQTLALTISALCLRMVSGGAHCSSYDRCLLFSLLIFVPTAVLLKFVERSVVPAVITAIYLSIAGLTAIYLAVSQVRAAVFVAALNGLVILVCFLLQGTFLPGIMLAIGTGFFIQAALHSLPGQWLVGKADQVMKRVKI